MGLFNRSLSSTGAGGVQPIWIPDAAGNAATDDVENLQEVFLFETTLQQKVYGLYKVPNSYPGGLQITLRLALYSPSTTASNNVRFQAVATLLKAGTNAFDSSTNQNTANSGDVALSATANMTRIASITLTSVTGTINSVAVASNDVIKIELSRIDASANEDSSILRLVKASAEVVF